MINGNLFGVVIAAICHVGDSWRGFIIRFGRWVVRDKSGENAGLEMDGRIEINNDGSCRCVNGREAAHVSESRAKNYLRPVKYLSTFFVS